MDITHGLMCMTGRDHDVPAFFGMTVLPFVQRKCAHTMYHKAGGILLCLEWSCERMSDYIHDVRLCLGIIRQPQN